MTISDFARKEHGDAPVGKFGEKNSGVRREYRALKRQEAEERQAVHEADVIKTAADQNIGEKEARDVVHFRKRMLHKRTVRTGRRTRRASTS